ncbi:carbamoyltransferase C-terminal domain-containing protein [Streptomyces mirabilis]|uniref:carbamoyltransferase C-terminal domain-containing protein n=1 Tax=Streptomyces mirabilis TaxID=68239 RepID=UPI00367A904D
MHVDGTARVQTVDPATAPAYGVLIEHFHQFTGLPLVLNTSYNNREPLVQTPAHTLATLQACDLDAACIGPPRPATLNGMTTSTPPLREAARAVVLDADQRVLLLRYDENGVQLTAPSRSIHEPSGLVDRRAWCEGRSQAADVGGEVRASARGPRGQRGWLVSSLHRPCG